MLYIDHVEKGKDVHGCEIITHVYWTNVLTQKASKKCTKREMINFINNKNKILARAGSITAQKLSTKFIHF